MTTDKPTPYTIVFAFFSYESTMLSSIKCVYLWSISDASVTEFLQKKKYNIFIPYVVLQGTFDGPERVESSVPQGLLRSWYICLVKLPLR